MSEIAEQYQVSKDYHADTTSVSKTQLNEFVDSPVQYKLMYRDKTLPRKSASKPMLLGTIMHAILLEKKEPDEIMQVYPKDCYKKNGTINPIPAGKFRNSIFPKIAVKSRDCDEVLECFKAVVKSELWDAIEQSTECEKRHDAVVHGLPCRCKPDILCDMGSHILIYDLKFCPPNPADFKRSARRFRYWLQDAHYSAVLANETGKPVQFRFFAVEPQFPFRIQSYWYGIRQREIARDAHRNAVLSLLECINSDTWEDNWPNELPLEPWDVGAMQDEDPELEGFDDE